MATWRRVTRYKSYGQCTCVVQVTLFLCGAHETTRRRIQDLNSCHSYTCRDLTVPATTSRDSQLDAWHPTRDSATATPLVKGQIKRYGSGRDFSWGVPSVAARQVGASRDPQLLWSRKGRRQKAEEMA
ncbi:hypothetical protein ACE6H2_006086 [Prunus campanulata]